jgi:hypothetical protein
VIEAKPKRLAKIIEETKWEDYLVHERLSILEKAKVIVKIRGYYYMVKELSDIDNYELELGCINMFKKHPDATISTIYLCKRFVCSYDRMNRILYGFVNGGLLRLMGEDMFMLADTYHVQETAARTLTNRIFA